MKLTPPKVVTFFVAVALGVLGLIGRFGHTAPVIGPYNFWFVFVGLVLLVFGVLVKDL